MNTPAHLIVGLAAFGRPGNRRVTGAALAGALTPDISLYAMVSWSIWVKGVSPAQVFGEYYYSPEWQSIFAIDNSFIIWAIALAFAIWARAPAPVAFCAAGLLHLALDFPLHNDDARMHFWPASDWIFISPVSYWDSAYHAGLIAPAELGICLILAVVLLARFARPLTRLGIAALATAELAAGGLFAWLL